MEALINSSDFNFAFQTMFAPLMRINYLRDSVLRKFIQDTDIFIASSIIAILLGVLVVLFYYFRLKQRKLERHVHNAIIKSKIEAHEDEMNRIARELHDGVASKLIGLKYQLSGFCQLFSKDDSLDSLIDNFNTVYKEVRDISHNLIMPAFSGSNLIEITSSYLKKFNSSKLQINFSVFPPEAMWSGINNSVNTEVYRIIQELMSNTLKHADASEVNIQLLTGNNSFTLNFEDNGKGFNVLDVKKGIGLLSIENRVSMLNGDFNIDSSPGNGTSINILIPMEEHKKKKVSALSFMF